MNPANLIDHALNQGTLFWVAAGWLGLGLTLILAAAIAQFRRLRAGRRRRFSAPARTVTISTPPAEPVVIPAAAPEPVAAVNPARPEEMRGLLTRLRRAADRLDAHRRHPAGPTAESPLKQPPPAVEYVFRAGKG